MKNYLMILMLFSITSGFAQSGFGIKGGLNYGDNGEISYTDVTNAGEDIIKGGDSKVGYHFGAFYRGDIGGFFLRPELLYTRIKSSYQFNDQEADYNVSKLDMPVLVGMDLLGPLNIFAGPSLQYILKNDFDGVSLGDVENEFSIGAQFGVGISFGGIGLDVRYERALKENEATVLDLSGAEGLKRVDTRPNQLIFSLSMKL
ncbi:outer membrane beta-barrel protein [Salinimicrobium oceani]|uniref:PorT family protein n=1 Tax=Salinimicrobium oceani TaxID=2722702 RepID=A0ABX1D0D8_9FLAO|nr:outer membrane beta-barrel protein [Salinimicrobium oceani]NJW53982.1 PorT family protein [Salinimicrobium oceani]